MGYLIEVDSEQLSKGVAFDMAKTHLMAASRHVEEGFWASLQKPRGNVVRHALPRVTLTTQHEPGACVWAGSGDWELSEVHRQLCQAQVLIAALDTLSILHRDGRVTGLSPTQQGGYDGQGTCGDGSTWALEVFGGIDVRNNNKAKADREALVKSAHAYRYFACFADAWKGYTPKVGRFTPVGAPGTDVEVRLVE